MANEVEILVTARNKAKLIFAEIRADTKRFADDAVAGFRRIGTEAGQMSHSVEAAARRAAAGLKAVGVQADRTGDELARSSVRGSSVLNRGFETIGRSIGAVVLRLKDLAITAGLAFVAATGAAGLFGIKMAAANETAMVSFELLLGSVSKAQSFLAKLQAFSAATPFEMPTLKDAASRLLAVGVNADRIIPIMTRLGDATSGMGTGAEGIARAVYALQQMSQAGKVSLEDINQLTDAGIPALDALSSKLGMTVAKLRDEISAGRIKPEMLFSAIEQGAGATFKRLNGMMVKQSATLSGIWSTFKDNASQSLAKFTEPAMPALKRLVSFSADVIPKMLGGIQNFGRMLGETFKNSTVPEHLMKALQKMGHEIIPVARDALHSMAKTLRDNKEGLEKLGHFIANNVIPVIGFLIKYGLGSLAVAFNVVVTVISHLVDAFNLWRAMTFTTIKFIVDTIRNGLGIIVHGAAAAFGWIPGLGPKLKDAASEFDKFFLKVDNELDRLAGKKVDVRVQASYTGPAARAFTSRTNIRAMASGGIGGGLTLVGERAAELVDLPQGSRVRSGADTQRILAGMAAGGGQGGAEGRFEAAAVPRTGDRLMDEIIRSLRLRIRHVTNGSAERFFARA